MAARRWRMAATSYRIGSRKRHWRASARATTAMPPCPARAIGKRKDRLAAVFAQSLEALPLSACGGGDGQVGSAGFKIDLGVRDKRSSRYLLAVECDGATYHRARWARERDRLRQQVLEQFGWRFHRIWSTDWFKNRKREIRRLAEAVQRAELDSPPPASSRSDIEGSIGLSRAKSDPTMRLY
jgi:hypothetical protein